MPDSPAHRAGVVALLGRPNAGKSTLLNRLLGEKLAIVTPKPQTTRSRLLGILSLPHAQVLLLDTPGFHEGGRALNRALNEVVGRVVADCDAALLLVDPATGWDAGHEALREQLRARGAPLRVVATKADRPTAGDAPLPADLRVSARSGEGMEALLAAILELLPEGPALYPEDDLTDRSQRFLAAEQVREAVFEELGQELPYATAVEVEEYDVSRPGRVRIRAHLLVEERSQKGMVIGKGGAMIARIGRRARAALEEQLGEAVDLELWVKHEPRWTRKPNRLKSLGYW